MSRGDLAAGQQLQQSLVEFSIEAQSLQRLPLVLGQPPTAPSPEQGPKLVLAMKGDAVVAALPQWRERIDRMLDSDSFHEYGALAGSTRYDDEGRLIEFRPSNFVLGTGRINGRKVVVGGDDFTVRGGAADAAIHSKQVWGEMLAEEHRMPIVRLVDGSGGGGSVRVFETVKATYVTAIPGFDVVVRLMGEVPVVAGCMGSVAGLGAARVAASHFAVMVRGSSQLFVAGPPVVKFGVGEDLTKEELGGSHIHAYMSGAVDNEAESEDDAFAQIRRFLSYLPQNVAGASADGAARRSESP